MQVKAIFYMTLLFYLFSQQKLRDQHIPHIVSQKEMGAYVPRTLLIDTYDNNIEKNDKYSVYKHSESTQHTCIYSSLY